MSFKVDVQNGGSLTPEECGEAGFRAGWRAACEAIADALRAVDAPKAVTDAVLESAATPPGFRVVVHRAGVPS
jgi:hypothetical protein